MPASPWPEEGSNSLRRERRGAAGGGGGEALQPVEWPLESGPAGQGVARPMGGNWGCPWGGLRSGLEGSLAGGRQVSRSFLRGCPGALRVGVPVPAWSAWAVWRRERAVGDGEGFLPALLSRSLPQPACPPKGSLQCHRLASVAFGGLGGLPEPGLESGGNRGGPPARPLSRPETSLLLQPPFLPRSLEIWRGVGEPRIGGWAAGRDGVAEMAAPGMGKSGRERYFLLYCDRERNFCNNLYILQSIYTNIL